MKQIILLSGILMIKATLVTAQSRIYVNEYLNIGVGARALAMGGAQTASSGDVNSGYWNTAGLAKIKDD